MQVIYSCWHCNSKVARVVDATPHKKLICAECKKYLKFIGAPELKTLAIHKPPKDKILNSETEILDEINFKLDLIITRLNKGAI